MKVIRDNNPIMLIPLLVQYGIDRECFLSDCESKDKKVTTIIIESPEQIYGICEECYNKIKQNKA